MRGFPHLPCWLLLAAWVFPAIGTVAAPPQPIASASSSAADHPPDGALDGDRFQPGRRHAWQGLPGAGSWTWQVDFGRERRIGSWLQVVGDHDFVLRNAPRTYVWEGSRDGLRWEEWLETRVEDDGRLMRNHRLPTAQRVRFVRLQVTGVHGEAPTLREVEMT